MLSRNVTTLRCGVEGHLLSTPINLWHASHAYQDYKLQIYHIFVLCITNISEGFYKELCIRNRMAKGCQWLILISQGVNDHFWVSLKNDWVSAISLGKTKAWTAAMVSVPFDIALLNMPFWVIKPYNSIFRESTASRDFRDCFCFMRKKQIKNSIKFLLKHSLREKVHKFMGNTTS